MSALSTAGSRQIDAEPERLRTVPVTRQQHLRDLTTIPIRSLPIAVGLTELVQAQDTSFGQSHGSDWRRIPGLIKSLSRLGTDEELHIEGDPTSGPPPCANFDEEPDLKAVSAPQTLFGASETMTTFANQFPSWEWQSISLEYYLQSDEGILARIAGLDQRCNNTVGLLAGEQKFRVRSCDLIAALPGLLVIDCFSLQVVAAKPSFTYVALSYVWGTTTGGQDEGNRFRTDLRGCCIPRTIRDAINVVRVLGVRYLWVDRYCINIEPRIKHLMISNMDAIYKAACLTIIAAAGSDDGHGLPSVSRTLRALDSDVTPPWDGIVYSEFSGPHLKQFNNSIYSTRGWTFQENLLSRRRLIFTQDRATLYYSSKARVRNANEIFAHINEYSRRSLKLDSDLLNAFLGVFRAYEKLQPPVKHIWGLPFLQAQDENTSRPAYGLLWRPNRNCSLNRIPGMPSWTWAGWSGWSAGGGEFVPNSSRLGPYVWLVDNIHLLLRGTRAWEPSDVSLEVEVGSQLTNLADYFHAGHRQQSGDSGESGPVLYVTAWSTIVNVHVSLRASIRLSDKDLDTAGLAVDPRPEVLYKGEPLVNGQWHCQWTAAIICWAARDTHDKTLHTLSLLLERVGENTYRRVGVLNMNWQKSDLDKHGRIAALDRSFTRTRLRVE